MDVSQITPETIINGLRLLLDGYKVARDRFKDKKTPDRIEEIVIRAEKAEPKTVSNEDIERSIKEDLEPSDAAIVRGDLDLLGLLLLPAPTLEAFDYWGKLSRLVAGLQAWATKNRFFELRGSKGPLLGEVLLLPRTAKCILPSKHAVELVVAPERWRTLREADCVAFLQKETQKFPIVVIVEARFNVYSPMGGPPGTRADHSVLDIKPGQQPHWLMFDRGDGFHPHFGRNYEYMLEATELITLVQALRDDIREYATAIQLDEEKIASCFAAIDAFTEGSVRGLV
jgi:hypothetical protein